MNERTQEKDIDFQVQYKIYICKCRLSGIIIRNHWKSWKICINIEKLMKTKIKI